MGSKKFSKFHFFSSILSAVLILTSVASDYSFAIEPTDEELALPGPNGLTTLGNVMRFSEFDRDRVMTLVEYLKRNEKPSGLRDQANWYVGLAKVIPTVLLSAEINPADFPWAFDNHNQNATMGPYSIGEAVLPLGFLRSIYTYFFPANPLELNYISFTPPPGSIPFSPLTLGLVDAVSRTGIHVLTAELKAHILMTLFHAPDAAYGEWTDDETPSPTAQKPTPRLVRLKVAQALADNYWISANSGLVQEHLVSLLHYEDVVIRAYLVKAAGAGIIGWDNEKRQALVDSIIEELPVHISGIDGMADEHATYITCALEALEQLSLWLTEVRPLARSVLLALKRGITASHGQLAFARGRPDLAAALVASLERVEMKLRRSNSDCASWLTNPPTVDGTGTDSEPSEKVK